MSFDHLRAVGVVLARGGSRGIPGKNARPLAGVPLLVRAVERLRAVSGLARILVSTDAPELAELARAAGAEVPFERPAELARDETPALEALRHAVRWLVEVDSERAGTVLLHQATSPFCTTGQIGEALARFHASEASVLRSVTPVVEHPHWMGTIEDGRLRYLTAPEQRATRRQDLPALYRLNGAINIYRTRELLAGVVDERAPLAFVMDPASSLDLDTPDDWARAEARLIS